ncbi:MAG: PBSX family phage terminase large subunit [Clostridiales bacterium]|jgi:PBSX family phage terminase large subunit|nr:PBSX family phage terminase large subunit [Clostridiales bacterium]
MSGQVTAFTEKQREFINAVKRGGLRRLNILDGSVSSGKTVISALAWVMLLGGAPPEGNFLMTGKTLGTLKRNVLTPLEAMFGEKRVSCSLAAKEAKILGRRVFLEGAADARAESKIRGMTLSAAYCDEITLFPRDFFVMLLSRLRAPGALLIGTTNPAGPNHWLMTDYIAREGELSLRRFSFRLDDNTFLPPEYVENLKKEYSGAFYERFIEGKWALADGLVYSAFRPGFVVKKSEIPRVSRWWVGVDYGQSNATAFLLAGLGSDGRLYLASEYYHSNRSETKAPKSPAAYAKDFVAWVKGFFARRGERVPEELPIFYDPAALGFKTQLAEAGVRGLKKADNDVLKGIQVVSAMYDRDLIRVCSDCVNFLKELHSYSWDAKAAAAGRDAPVKTEDHAQDAFRYLVMGGRAHWKGGLTAGD